MIVKWLKKTGNGSAAATVNYMLGKDRDRAGAKALNGIAKIERTAKLADSLATKHKYAVGVLSFEESPDAISDTKKIEIMESFERTIFAGLDHDQYDIAWIEHTDKGRLELNFIIPKVELRSGRAMNPYLHGKDTPLIDSWKNIINNQYGLTDPNDPARRHTTTHRQRLPKDKRELAEAIDESITIGITSGTIKDRADIIEHLAELGLEVTKQTKQSLSVHHEAMGKRPLRLTGVYYEQDFKSSSIDQEYIAARSAEYRARAAERLRADKAEHQRLLESRSKYNQNRYSQAAEAVSSTRSRRIRSSDQPSSAADRTADRATTAAHQWTDHAARIADIAASDQPATAVIRPNQSASEQDGRRSELLRDPTASNDRSVRGTTGSSQGYDGYSTAGSRSAAVEHRQHDYDDQAIAGQASKNVRIGGAAIQNDGRTGWPADAGSDISHRIDSEAYATTHRSDAAAHDSAAGNDRQDSRQASSIDHTQAISADILPVGRDRMVHAASDNNSVQRLQYVQQFQDIERPSAADQPATGDIVRHQQDDQRSERNPAGQLGDDRSDAGRHIDQITPSDSYKDHQQGRINSIPRPKSVTDQEITDHDTNPFFAAIRAAFKRVRAATARAATATLDRVRTRITAATGSATAARRYDQRTDDRDRHIDDIITALKRRERAAASAAGSAAADNRHDDSRDRELAQHSSSTAQDDQRIERYNDGIQSASRTIERTEQQIIDTDRTLERTEQRTREQSQQIEWIDRKIQDLNQHLNQQPRPAEPKEERRRAAADEYSSPTPFD